MDAMFKGLAVVENIAEQINAREGAPVIQIATVSSEPTSYGPGQFPIVRVEWAAALKRLFDACEPNRDDSWRDFGVDFENETFFARIYNEDPQCTCTYATREKRARAGCAHSGECFQNRIKPLVEAAARRYPLPDLPFMQPISRASMARTVQMIRPDAPGPTSEAIEQEKRDDREYERARSAYFRADKLQRAAIRAAVRRLGASMKIDRAARLSHSDAQWSMWEYICTCGADDRFEKWRQANHGAHQKPCAVWWGHRPNFLHKPSGYSVDWYKYPCRESHGNQPIDAARLNAIVDECIASLLGTP